METNKIISLIKRGFIVIMPGTEDEWIKCVVANIDGLYGDSLLDDALQIMEHLAEGGTIKDAIEIFEYQRHSGTSAAIVKRIILAHSKYGVDFYRAEAESINVPLSQKEEFLLQQQQILNNFRFKKEK